MLHFHLKKHPHKERFLQLEVHFDSPIGDTTQFHLPAWRPGRYELMNYASKVYDFEAFDAENHPLKWKKTSRNTWFVEPNPGKNVLRYSFLADRMDAGGSWVDDKQLYVNPVNCFLYSDEAFDKPCSVAVEVPEGWEGTFPLPCLRKNVWQAANFDELLDNPFVFSNQMTCLEYRIEDVPFLIWLNGGTFSEADKDRILSDFKAFSLYQLKLFGDFPFDQFHFFIHLLPNAAYHGVEHLKSTVITLGPANLVMTDHLYPELLGVSSHELFHCWNIKTIRPASMLPYDFKRENYSELGYVYEGFTTYYGDLLLMRSGVFGFEQFASEINTHLLRHTRNYGRFNHSLAESSTDTWVDGYEKNTRHRRVSIYVEGALNAMILDLILLKESGGKFRLDDLMVKLYAWAKEGKGYSETMLIKALHELASYDWELHFSMHYHSKISLEKAVNDALKLVGCHLVERPNGRASEVYFGMEMERWTVGNIAPGSPAERCGLSFGDEIIEIENIQVASGGVPEDFWLTMSTVQQPMQLTVKDSIGQLRPISLMPSSEPTFYPVYEVVMNGEPTTSQKALYEKWIS